MRWGWKSICFSTHIPDKRVKHTENIEVRMMSKNPIQSQITDQAITYKISNAVSGDPITDSTIENVRKALLNLEKPVYIFSNSDGANITASYFANPGNPEWTVASFCPAIKPENLGDRDFKSTYNLKYALYGGAMANAIASEEFVIALGKAGFMGSFGAGGCVPSRIEKAINTIKEALREKPYVFNLINSPFEPALEQKSTELYLQHGIKVIEASAYLNVTKNLVRYRVCGLSQKPDGSIDIGNHIIAKLSRKEVATKFLQPASDEILSQLVSEGLVTELQAKLAKFVPIADDITVEADSGGHTDNRPLVGILPAIIRLRDEMHEKYQYKTLVRVGAAGGIATPSSAVAAFMMGAAYLTTGSINQGCVEAGASEHTRTLLSQMEMTDVAMAPASDMFEMGVKVQVLKRGTMFAMRGQKLYELFQRYNSIDEIPAEEREKLETTIFKQPLNTIWEECVRFFAERDPKQIERANQKPKDKMALIFRWYLGLSSRWSNIGEKGREMDYQIWCGPAMGAFNDWVRGTYLETAQNRSVADVSIQLLRGAAYLNRVRMLESFGIKFSNELLDYRPQKESV
jgi:trans-AT polyketide synthase, acyltransferase and oxidoreductase domains